MPIEIRALKANFGDRFLALWGRSKGAQFINLGEVKTQGESNELALTRAERGGMAAAMVNRSLEVPKSADETVGGSKKAP
jgi:hypothetical protein